MARIAGTDLPRDKRVEVGLTYIFGVGRSTSLTVLQDLDIDINTKVRDLTDSEVVRIRQYIDANVTVEVDTIDFDVLSRVVVEPSLLSWRSTSFSWKCFTVKPW